jgi:hypothetical protein
VSQLGPRARRAVVALAVLLLAGGVTAGIVLGPEIDEAKERDEARRERAEMRRLEARRRQARGVQRARTGRLAPPAPGAAGTGLLAARERMVALAGDRILADARTKAERGDLARRARFVEFEPFPRSRTTVDPRAEAAARRGRYTCLAVTVRSPETERAAAFDLGYPYRLAMDFQSGRYAYCRVLEQAGEGALRGRPLVALPAACS